MMKGMPREMKREKIMKKLSNLTSKEKILTEKELVSLESCIFFFVVEEIANCVERTNQGKYYNTHPYLSVYNMHHSNRPKFNTNLSNMYN